MKTNSVSEETPIVLITPEAKAALEAEVGRIGIGGDLAGGLLFGYPLDERRRLVVGLIRLTPEVGFGHKDFSLDQSRTSQHLERARRLSPKADYCGVWYLHRIPDWELSKEEWNQAQSVLEDPDFRFRDMVCLVLCSYSGKSNVYTSLFSRHHSARGQLPQPATLQLTTEAAQAARALAPPPAAPPREPTEWYKLPDIAERLIWEQVQLTQKYRVESAAAPSGQVVFRLMPKGEHEDMVFYLACGPGFPHKAPAAFLAVRGDRYPLLSPSLNEWKAEQRLVDLADELVKWQVQLLDQQVAAAREALAQDKYQEASDLLAMVLLVDPRKRGAARLMALAQAGLEAVGE